MTILYPLTGSFGNIHSSRFLMTSLLIAHWHAMSSSEASQMLFLPGTLELESTAGYLNQEVLESYTKVTFSYSLYEKISKKCRYTEKRQRTQHIHEMRQRKSSGGPLVPEVTALLVPERFLASEEIQLHFLPLSHSIPLPLQLYTKVLSFLSVGFYYLYLKDDFFHQDVFPSVSVRFALEMNSILLSVCQNKVCVMAQALFRT